MANSLYITYSGGTVDLNSGTTGGIRMLTQYVPKMGDGETTVDSVEIEFSGTAVSQIQTNIQAINKAMQDAITYNTKGVGTRVYAYFQPDGYASAWRSELVPESAKDWRLELDSDSLSDARWVSNTPKKVKGLLIWKRVDWWERPSTSEVNDGVSDYKLTNSNDGSPNTYVGEASKNYIPPAYAIEGDIPTPIVLSFLFIDQAAPNALHVGVNTHSSYPAGGSLTTQLEAESYATIAAGGSKVANTYASGGTFTSIPLPPNVDTELLRWNGTETFFKNYNGDPATIFIVFGGTVLNDWVENTKYSIAFINRDSSRVYYQTDYVYLENYSLGPVQKMLTMQIPPGYDDKFQNSVPTYYAISLYARQNTTGTLTPQIDFIEFMPSASFRSYYIDSASQSLYSDPARNYNFLSSTTAGNYTPIGKMIGGGVMIEPGMQNTVFFKVSGTATYTNMHNTMEAFLLYRPRRRLL